MSDIVNNYNHLVISEDFYSVQGEGITTGCPSYFIRLKDCNLTCGATRAVAKQVKGAGLGNTDPGSFKGDLHAAGKATWTCDSLPVWLFGEKKPFEYLINRWREHKNYDGSTMLDWILSGQTHLIWTGGEPTLPKHQECIANFIHHLADVYQAEDSAIDYGVYNEIETNGTQYIDDMLYDELHQINCSAKLSNSGLDKEDRIVPEAIERIKNHWNSRFKFVISTEEDIKEIITDYLVPFNIPMTQVVCMPGMDSRENFHERTAFVLEMAKKYGFTGLSRLHVSAWDKTCSV
jgi:hypothetical protein